MAAAILPAIRAGGSAVAKYGPALVTTVKDKLPDAYDKLKKLTSYSNNTPEALARTASGQGNGMIMGGLIGNALKAGVPPELIMQTIPLLGPEDLAQMQSQYNALVVSERKFADTQVPRINNTPAAVLEKEVENMCDLFNFTSNQLAAALTFFRVHGPGDIAVYQSDRLTAGKRPR